MERNIHGKNIHEETYMERRAWRNMYGVNIPGATHMEKHKWRSIHGKTHRETYTKRSICMCTCYDIDV